MANRGNGFWLQLVRNWYFRWDKKRKTFFRWVSWENAPPLFTKEVFNVQAACTWHSSIKLPTMTHREALRINPNESPLPPPFPPHGNEMSSCLIEPWQPSEWNQKQLHYILVYTLPFLYAKCRSLVPLQIYIYKISISFMPHQSPINMIISRKFALRLNGKQEFWEYCT